MTEQISNVFLGFVLAIVGIAVVAFVSFEVANNDAEWRTKALVAGHAEYTFGDDGQPVWQWTRPCTEMTK